MGLKRLAATGAGLLMIVALPIMLVQSLRRPLKSLNALTQNMANIQTGKGMHWAVKGAIMVVFGLGAAVLAPFAALQKTGQLIISGFKAMGRGIKNIFSKGEKIEELSAEAQQMNKKVSQSVNAQVAILSKLTSSETKATKKGRESLRTVEAVVERYEQSLQENASAVITLNSKELQKVNKYLSTHDDPALGQRF